jgi:hypothetical protein
MNKTKQTKDDFIAGFICAGGDVEDAKDQAEQFIKCCQYENKNMSPLDLEVLIHYHCNPYQHHRHDSPCVADATKTFFMDGIIDKSNKTGSGYTTTEKGRAWLAMILKTPYPTQCWVDGNGNRIDV